MLLLYGTQAYLHKPELAEAVTPIRSMFEIRIIQTPSIRLPLSLSLWELIRPSFSSQPTTNHNLLRAFVLLSLLVSVTHRTPMSLHQSRRPWLAHSSHGTLVNLPT